MQSNQLNLANFIKLDGNVEFVPRNIRIVKIGRFLKMNPDKIRKWYSFHVE